MTDWTRRYAIPDAGIPLYAGPHEGDGRRWVTDGRCLLAADDPTATLAPLNVPYAKPEVLPAAREFGLSPVPPDATRATLADLWAWLDRLEREMCPQCRGDTWPVRESASGVCTFCDGAGWAWPVPDPADADTVVVAGVKVDRNRLAWWLAGELEGYGPDCRVWSREVIGGRAVVLDGGGWRLVVMGLKPEYNPGKYRTYLPGAGAWWPYRRDPVSRMSAADWAAEAHGATAFDLFGVEYPELEGVGT